MLSSLLIDASVFSEYNLVDEGKELSNLSQINVFIGKNNSGKSRFLRRIFSYDELKFKSLKIQTALINEKLRDVRTEASNLEKSLPYKNHSPQLLGIVRIGDIDWIDRKFNLATHLDAVSIIQRNFTNSSDQDDLLQQIRRSSEKLIKDLFSVVPSPFPKFDYKRIYVPTLRGLRPLQHTNNNQFDGSFDNYSSRCLKDYFPGSNAENEIFSGLHLYEATKKLLLGTTEDRDKIRQFEVFLSKTFFDSQTVNIVPRIDHDVLHIRIGESERPIYDMGDGIQSIIILTYPLFFR